MPFLLLFFLTFVCCQRSWPQPYWELTGDAAVGLSAAVLALGVGLARVISLWVVDTLARDPTRREDVLHRYSALRFYHLLGLLGLYTLTLYVFGWGWLVMGHDSASWVPPGMELVLLAPFLVSLVLSWACFYDSDHAIHQAAPSGSMTRSFWRRAAFLTFQMRSTLGFVMVALVPLLVVNGLHRWFPQFEESEAYKLGGLGITLSVFVCMPWLVRLVMGMSSLPAGPLRDRLMATARRLRFKCSDILVWHTRNGVVNALVVGVLPRPRYVVLSDRLLNDLPPEEVEAVFGHEVGHVKHHHMLYYLTFLIISLMVLGAAAELMGINVDSQPQWAALPMGLYIFVVFGFLSRRCERQADIYGCKVVSCGRPICHGHDHDTPLVPEGRALCPTGIRTFIQALEKVAHLNGISRSKPSWLQSWQHSTIAKRVAFLQQILSEPAVEPRFQRRVFLIKWAMLVALTALFFAFVYWGEALAQ